ncbi:MAG: response regulator transcription factor [Myxococcales bacterium]
MTPRVLLVEDDLALGAQIEAQLRRAGYAPIWWKEGRRIDGPAPDVALVILDLMLPGVYGLDMLKSLRSKTDVPVLVLSARSDASDKVRALALGADDYLTKPFWPEELIERVKARLRRPTLQRQDRLEAGELVIDLSARAASTAGSPLELTALEFNLLLALVKREGQAVARSSLAEQVLDPERSNSERTLDVHVSRLRKKLGEHAQIETVWGIGYRFRRSGTP